MWTNAGLNHLSQFHSVLTWAKVWLRVAGETQEEWIAGECLCGLLWRSVTFSWKRTVWLFSSPPLLIDSFSRQASKLLSLLSKTICLLWQEYVWTTESWLEDNKHIQTAMVTSENLFLMIYTKAVKYVSLWKPSPLPSDVLCIPGVPGVVNGNTCEMLPQFIQETFASAEVWQLPVEVASHITAGERGGPGENRVEKQWAEQRQCIYSRVRSRLGVS